MSILEVKNLSHNFGDKQLFQNTGLQLNRGDKMGLTGLNGAGKTTFINILTGTVIPDAGSVKWHPKVRVGYLDQHAAVDESLTVRAYLACLLYTSGNQLVGRHSVGGTIFICGPPRVDCGFGLVARAGVNLVEITRQALPDMRAAQVHTVTVFGVVFKQGVRPGRTEALVVCGVGNRGSRAAPDGRTARGVGNIHTLAEQLGYKTRIRCLAATGAGAGVLKQRLLELRPLDRVGLEGEICLDPVSYTHLDVYKRQHNSSFRFGQ